MRSIAARFSLVVGVFAVVFSSFILYRAWSSARQHAEDLTSVQAELALEFDLAIREYAGEAIRPAMQARIGEEEFVVEAMSTSYIAREVAEKVAKRFPDHLLKFPSENPRNPKNKAGPEEMKLIRHFSEHPDESRWQGRLNVNGKTYYVQTSAMRTEESCLQCHGLPEDSPESLLDLYGDSGGFGYQEGDLAGIDMVGIPMDRVNAALVSQARGNLLATALWLAVLFAAILLAFRLVVTRRLAGITTHFQTAAAQDSGTVGPIPETGNDEITVMARSFNALAARLRDLYESLEQRVRERTAEITQEQQNLKHMLRSVDRERRLIAYEIHDGLAQQLTGAFMHLQNYDELKGKKPGEAAKAYEIGTGLVRRSLTEARRLISGLRPPILDDSGVEAAIEHLVLEHQEQEGAPEIVYHHDVSFDRLSPVMENAIFRIVQESLTNALDHSGTAKVQIDLAQDGDTVRIAVEDWGSGFDPDEYREDCFGLRGMRERARLLGGSCTIDSRPGRGTRIAVELPLVAAVAAP